MPVLNENANGNRIVGLEMILRKIMDTFDSVIKVSCIDKNGDVLSKIVRPDREKYYEPDPKSDKMAGSFATLVLGITKQGEPSFGETRYAHLVWEKLACVIIPITKSDDSIVLIVKHGIDAAQLAKSVLKQLGRQ